MAEYTPEQWRDRLEHRLHERWSSWSLFDAYYVGDQRLNFATQKWNDTFAARFGKITDNWCPIVVDSTVERLTVQGFRFGQEQEADQEAWDIWQANNLDSGSEMAHTESVKLGESYWLVEPPLQQGGAPRITAEHPSQVIVAHVPGDRQRRMAAFKKWIGEDGYAYCTLYLPDFIYKWESKKPLDDGGVIKGKIDWIERLGDPGGRNALGVVPVIPLPNSPSMLYGGRSDLADIIDLQDAINKVLSDMMIGSEYQAFPQRVLTGVEIPRDENGQPLRAAALKAAHDRVWTFSNDQARVHEFSAADLKNYIDAKNSLVSDLAAQTRLPPQYVKGEITNASADALKMAEIGLVSRTRRKMPSFGAAHVEAIQLAFRSMGDEARANEIVAQTIWVDPESRSVAQVVDAAVKQKELNVPDEVLWEKIGYSPQEIERMRTVQAQDVLFQDVSGIESVPTSGETETGNEGQISAWLDELLRYVREGNAEAIAVLLASGWPDQWDESIDEMTYAGREGDLELLRRIIVVLRSVNGPADAGTIRSLLAQITGN
jgi:hypothetical protein